MNQLPQILVVGGPSGSGKTTFVREAIRNTGLPYIGADEIADRLKPDDPASVAVAAGREFIH